MAEAGTLPSLLLRNAAERGDRPAMREKDRGIWQTYSWRRVRDEVRDLALGLAALGFRRGDKLSVIGDNRPRLYWAQLAAQALGGASVPVYQDSIARELAYRLYTLCERKKRAAEALAYNGLVQSWPEIARLAREGGKPKAEQAVLFGEGPE